MTGSIASGKTVLGMAIVTALAGWTGCAQPTPPTGFLRDYSKLVKVKDGWMRYKSPQLASYSSFMIDPIEIHVKRDVLDDAKRAEVARYFREALIRVIRENNYRVVSEAGVGTGRLRVAITDIQESKWYLNIHPATKITGAGRGGASMEAEVLDSVTGDQLAATVRSGQGKQFELNPFSTVDDVKNVIDRWANDAGERLKEMREGK